MRAGLCEKTPLHAGACAHTCSRHYFLCVFRMLVWPVMSPECTLESFVVHRDVMQKPGCMRQLKGLVGAAQHGWACRTFLHGLLMRYAGLFCNIRDLTWIVIETCMPFPCDTCGNPASHSQALGLPSPSAGACALECRLH